MNILSLPFHPEMDYDSEPFEGAIKLWANFSFHSIQQFFVSFLIPKNSLKILLKSKAINFQQKAFINFNFEKQKKSSQNSELSTDCLKYFPRKILNNKWILSQNRQETMRGRNGDGDKIEWWEVNQEEAIVIDSLRHEKLIHNSFWCVAHLKRDLLVSSTKKIDSLWLEDVFRHTAYIWFVKGSDVKKQWLLIKVLAVFFPA